MVATAGAITFAQVALLPNPGRGLSEYFEAASVVILYVVAAVVVAVLASSLRTQRNAAQDTLANLEATRDQLVREERLGAVGRLASALAHEIRNPVAMIVSSLAMARSGGVERNERPELDALVEQEAGRLERLTADFLAFARQRPPALESTHVEVAIGYVAGLAQAQLLAAGLEVAIDVEPGLEAEVDPFQIHQALLNLVVNAIAAAPSGSVIRLGAARAGGPAAAVRRERRVGGRGSRPRAHLRAVLQHAPLRNGPRPGDRSQHCARPRRRAAARGEPLREGAFHARSSFRAGPVVHGGGPWLTS